MKTFESPSLERINDLTEGVYADSGNPGTFVPGIPSTPITPNTPAASDWTWAFEDWSHNSGSHSDARLRMHYAGKAVDAYTRPLVMTFTTGFAIDNLEVEFQDTTFQVLGNGFSITYNGHLNATENIDMRIRIYQVKNNGVDNAAIGVSGAGANDSELVRSIRLVSMHYK